MKHQHRNIVSALIFSQDSKLFLGQKDPQAGGVYPDCWHLPGGGVEPGESQPAALVREIAEETGIDIGLYQPVLVDGLGSGQTTKINPQTRQPIICHMKFFVYRVDLHDQLAKDIQVNLTSDLVKYHWASIEELFTLKLTPPSIKLFKRLRYI